MKIVLIISLITAIVLIAMRLSEQIKDKYDFYFNLKNFLNDFKLNLAFKQEKIMDFLNKTKPRKQFSIFIEDYKNFLNTNSLDINNLNNLTDDEREELSQIVINMGKFSSSVEQRQIDTFLEKVNQNLIIYDEQKKKLCPMIIKLSLLLAIGLAIILI